MQQYKPVAESFETIEGIAKSTTTQVVKSAQKGAADVARDVQQQIVPDLGPSATGGGKLNKMPAEEQVKVTEQSQEMLSQTRSNLAKIDAEIKRAREERIKHYQDKIRKDTEAKNAKKAHEIKEEKKEQSVLDKVLAGKKGSHEMSKRVGG